MWFLWFLLVINTVQAQAGFGRSYLGNSRLCHKWNCFNEKLNLTDALPSKDVYSDTIKSLFSSEWREVVDNAVESCYENRTRKYTNTCPGQALLLCVVDNLIKNCPETKRSNDDRCTPVSSISAYNFMIFQSRYNDFELSLPTERRPEWFLRNYFNTKCCELPDILVKNNLSECGFKKFIEYHIHDSQTVQPFRYAFPKKVNFASTTEKSELQIVDLQDIEQQDSEEEWDPLECCDVSNFIDPSWRNECHFEMSWNVTDRLGFIDVSSHEPPTTTEQPKVIGVDAKIVPLSCEKETCIFKKLDIILDSGDIDTVAFSKLLDNMTKIHPDWVKAKARVATQCFTKLHRVYEAECRINEVLSCVLDVLHENCPYAMKEDPCKNRDGRGKEIICQISSGKYAPKLRRQICDVPSLVSSDVLSECGVTSLSTVQYMSQYERQRSSHWESRFHCKELTRPTSCVLNKMEVLNQYGFVDYFKIKNLLQKASTTPIYELLFSAFLTTPMYGQYCSSPKKLLNILDFMVMTCPASKRTKNPKCNKIFQEIVHTPNITQDDVDKLFKILETKTQSLSKPEPKPKLHNKKIFDFGILGSNAPPVKIIDVKPKPKTLVILPVYQRMNQTFPLNSLHNDGIYRSLTL